MFGDQICAELSRDNVNLSMVKRVSNPTTLAFVSFATGEPQYAFFYNDAADRSLTPATLPSLPSDAAAMHLSMGAITCEVEPVGAYCPPPQLPSAPRLFDSVQVRATPPHQNLPCSRSSGRPGLLEAVRRRGVEHVFIIRSEHSLFRHPGSGTVRHLLYRLLLLYARARHACSHLSHSYLHSSSRSDCAGT